MLSYSSCSSLKNMKLHCVHCVAAQMLHVFLLRLPQGWCRTSLVYIPDSALYYSLAKEHPLTKECPPPTFGPISCTGSKFTQMRTHPGISYAWNLRSTSSSPMHVWGKKLHVVLHKRLLQGIFVYIDTANVVCAVSYTIVTVTWQFRVLCAIRTWLLNPLVVLLHVH